MNKYDPTIFIKIYGSIFVYTGLTLPAVSVNHKNITLPVKPGFSPSAPNGTIASSTVGVYYSGFASS